MTGDDMDGLMVETQIPPNPPFAKGGTPQVSPFETSKGLASPFEKGTLQTSPFEKGSTQTSPFEKGSTQTSPFEKGSTQTSPFEKGSTQTSPFEKGSTQTSPFEKGGSRGIYQKKDFKMKPYKKSLKQPSRQLRHELTDAEQLLWNRLRRKQIHNVLFNRQKPLLSYIVDFYCAKAKLVIELDGNQHFDSENREKDIIRDKALAKLGLHILRFDNRQVLTETDSVVGVVYEIVGERLHPSEIPPNPPFPKGGT